MGTIRSRPEPTPTPVPASTGPWFEVMVIEVIDPRDLDRAIKEALEHLAQQNP
jgi:hypothetical protein